MASPKDEFLDLVIDEIVQSRIEIGRYGYYLVDENFDVQHVGHGSEEHIAMRELMMLIHENKHIKSYVRKNVYLVELDINKRYSISGPVKIRIIKYDIDGTFSLSHKWGDTNGTLWYTVDDLLNGAFHIQDIPKLIKILYLHPNQEIHTQHKVKAVNVLNENFD